MMKSFTIAESEHLLSSPEDTMTEKSYMSKLLGGRNGNELVEEEPNYARQNTFAAEGRKTTFSRAFTFDGEAIRNQIAQPFSGLTRTLTEVGQRFDPDAQFTKAVIAEYTVHAESGMDGDMPLPPGFAGKGDFWRMIFLVSIVSCLMGLISAAFMNFGDEIPKQWNTCDFDNDAHCGDFYTGKTYWILITGGAGFTVGMIRWTFDYPDNLPGLFKEVTTFHVDPKWSPLTFLISAISLGGGAALGPEQGLGNVGGGLATWITEQIEFEDEDYRKIFVLTGMSAALGALFPTPMLGALMIHELGDPPKTFMESTMILSVAAVMGFAVYYELIGVTYLEHIKSSGIYFTLEWIKDPGYQSWQICTGFVIGVISAFLCIMVVFTIGVCKQVFSRIRQRLRHNKFLKEVVPPTLGGIIIGTVNWALPATVGNGNIIFSWIIKFGQDGQVSRHLLLCTAFARMFLLGVSMNCGFVGGIIFPYLTMGLISGTIMYTYFNYVPLGLCLSCFMISIACGIVPLPFTFTCLSAFVWYNGLYQVVPIFVAAITSYLIVCGSGLFKKMGTRAQENAAKQNEALRLEDEAKLKEQHKKENEEFAVNQFLGNKKHVVPMNPSTPASN